MSYYSNHPRGQAYMTPPSHPILGYLPAPMPCRVPPRGQVTLWHLHLEGKQCRGLMPLWMPQQRPLSPPQHRPPKEGLHYT
jgi:hypothetical protein